MKRLALLLALAGCGHKKDAATEAPPPTKPTTGAPLAFVVDKVTPGAKGTLAVRAYNFSDKQIGTYMVLIRYYDASGAVVRVQPGTDFEASYDTYSMSGRSYLCEPKHWCAFEINPRDIPAKAVKAEMLAASLTAAGDMTHDLFAMEHMEWPGASEEAVPWPDPLKKWGDAKALRAAWQGAWTGDGFALGNAAAWSIKDDQVDFYDKKGNQKFKLSIDSPCTAGFGGGDGGWVSVFVVKGTDLITGLGDAGYKKGSDAIVCGGGDVWVFEGGTCTRWSSFMKWKSEPGVCGFEQKDGKEVFFYASDGSYHSQLDEDGDVLLTSQLANSHATKQASLDAAKAAAKL